MALDTYANLQTAVLDWMVRSELTGNVADWITLAEARLNRVLPAVEVDQSLSGSSSSREISLSSYSIVEIMAIYLIDLSTSDETELTQKADFARTNTNNKPKFWQHDPDATSPKLIFDCPLDQAYTFRMRYRQRFALSDSATTNWLLTNHSDIYLAAVLVWGSGFVEKFSEAGGFKAVLDEGIPEVRNIITQGKRAIAGVDPALILIGRRPYYDGVYDE